MEDERKCVLCMLEVVCQGLSQLKTVLDTIFPLTKQPKEV